jgi:Uma2 family endonuclease
MATATRVSLADFLAMEETKPYRELICGEVLEKEMPGQSHSDLAFAFNVELGLHLRAAGAGKGSPELRHLYVPEDRVYLPDISFISSDRLPPPDQDPVEVVPVSSSKFSHPATGQAAYWKRCSSTCERASGCSG